MPISTEMFSCPGVTGYCIKKINEKVKAYADGSIEDNEGELQFIFFKSEKQIYWAILNPISEETILLRSKYIAADELEANNLTPMILRCVEKTCKKNGYKKLMVNANTFTRKFYNILGFQETGEGFVLEGTFFLRMIKKL